MQRISTDRWKWLMLAALLCIAFAAGIAIRVDSFAEAQVREQAEPQAFKSGAARNETILRDIHATLERIDQRLERIEKASVQFTESRVGTDRERSAQGR